MMRCEDIGPRLGEATEHPDRVGSRAVLEHLEGCPGCRDAMRAVSRLRAEREVPVPGPRRGALRRALRAATAEARGKRADFWRGLATGGAAAAGLAVLSAMLLLPASPPTPPAAPEVTMALNTPRDVSIAIQAPAPLEDVEIRVTLRGAVDLRGFEGQRDIRWITDLEEGVNSLTLPVVATGEQGGQVQVVVHHGAKHKTFLVDVHARRAEQA